MTERKSWLMSGRKGQCAYGPLFARMRLAVFEVFGHRCVACGQKFPTKFLHAHHVAPYRYPCGAAECRCGAPKIAIGDLVPVCAGCHSVVERQKQKNRRRNGLPRQAGRPVVLESYEVEAVSEPDPADGLLGWLWKHGSGWSGQLDLQGEDPGDGFVALAWRSDHRESDQRRDWHASNVDPFEAIDRAIEAGIAEL